MSTAPRVIVNDGQGVDPNDWNRMSSWTRAQMLDVLMGAQMRTRQNMLGPVPVATQLFAIGHSGAPRNLPSVANGFGCNSGPLFYSSPSATVDGETPSTGFYFLQTNEITGSFAAGDATHPRFDAVFVKLQAEQDGATESRNWQDSGGTLFTTENVVTSRVTSLVWTVVQGTPAAKPLVPDPPDASWASWGVWYIPKSWHNQMSTMFNDGGSNVFDYRAPIDFTRHWCDVSRLYSLGLSGTTVDPSSGYASSSSTGLIVGAACPVRAGRIMACAFTLNRFATGGRNQVLVRTPASGGPNIEPPNWATIFGGVRSGDPTIAYSDTLGYVLQNGLWIDPSGSPVSATASGFALLPLWANGYGSEAEDGGQVGGNGGDRSWVTINWNSNGTTDQIMGASFDVAG